MIIGGVDGLVHISQLSYEHVDKPSDVVQEGQKVQVKILNVDRDNERISFSIKETLPGPWTNIAEKAPREVLLQVSLKDWFLTVLLLKCFLELKGLFIFHKLPISTLQRHMRF